MPMGLVFQAVLFVGAELLRVLIGWVCDELSACRKEILVHYVISEYVERFV